MELLNQACLDLVEQIEELKRENAWLKKLVLVKGGKWFNKVPSCCVISRVGASGAPILASGLFEGQDKREGSAFARFAVKVDVPVMVFGNTQRGEQTQSRPVNGRLGCKKRIENAIHVGFFNSAPGIFDVDFYVRTILLG